jgi:hypothetical protein
MACQGVGAAATWTSNLSILMAKFPDRKATVKVTKLPVSFFTASPGVV